MNTTQDANKQLASMRSYLIQFKDSVDSELNNVSYDMLSSPLRKKIDLISDAVQEIDNTKMSVNMLLANYVSVDVLEANIASVNQLIASKVTAQEVNAIIGNYGFLTAYDASITYIQSSVVYTDFMEVRNYVEAGKIKTSVLDVGSIVTRGNITSALNDPSQGEIDIGTVKAYNIYMAGFNAQGTFSGYKKLGSHYMSVSTTTGNQTYWFVTRES